MTREPAAPDHRHRHDHGAGHGHGHGHGEVHLGEDDWRRMAVQAEREGELYLSFVTEAAAWVAEVRGNEPIGRILDVGSGPGVGTCEWAERFPDAQVTAVDGSPAMLQAAGTRIAGRGLEGRVRTHHGELPGGLAPFVGTADVVWASMALHHVGDEVGALREMASCLRPGGLVAICEFGDLGDFLPAALGVGTHGLRDRIAGAADTWFAAMRAGLAGSVASQPLETMVAGAGLTVVGSRESTLTFEAPLDDAARRVAVDMLARTRQQLDGRLDAADAAALDALLDPDDPQGMARRPDARLSTSRLLVLAAP